MVVHRILAAAVLLAALALPTTAGAAQGTAGSHKPVTRTAAPPAKVLTAAAAIGRRHWGAVGCDAQTKVLARRPVPTGMHPDSDAWVTFDSPLGANNLAAPASSYTDCTISFASRRWPTSASMLADWEILCATMTHEMGHLLGRAHDDTPGDVMVSVFSDESSVPPICRSSRPGRPAGSARR